MPIVDPIEFKEGPVEERLAPPTGSKAALPDGFVDKLAADLGDGAVDAAEESLTAAGRDWWPLAVVWATQGRVPSRPAVVVRPSTTEEVAAVVRRCAEAGVPLTPAAGRSGVCGGSIPVCGGVVLDLTRMDAVLDVDDQSLLLTAQPGVFGDRLEADLQARGYTMGHWPQSVALSTLGGWLACRSAGQYSTRYGKIEDMVVALEAVTGTGEVLRTGGAPRAAVGPDLTQVLVGSEGTLAVITEATMRLHPKAPEERRAAWVIPTFLAGLDACRQVLRRGATPAVLRLYDEAESQRSYEVDGNVLIVLDEGEGAVVDGVMAVVGDVMASVEGAQPLDAAVVAKWLDHRNDVSALPKVVSAGIVVDTVELAGRWSVLDALYDGVRAALMAVEGTLVASAHCSHSYTDGACLYFTFAGRPGDDDLVKDDYYRRCFDAVMRTTVELGAAISHHHGIGLVRGPHMRSALGDAGFDALVGVKSVLDPAGILNPGKLGLPSPFAPEGWAWQ